MSNKENVILIASGLQKDMGKGSNKPNKTNDERSWKNLTGCVCGLL